MHSHNFELVYGGESIECSIDMDSSEITYSQYPVTLTTKQQQILNSLFNMLITVHSTFSDYQTLECNEA